MAIFRRTQVQTLPSATRSHPPPDELCRQHLGVVYHHPIAGPQKLREIANVGVIEGLARPIDNHQPRIDPVRSGCCAISSGGRV